MSLPLLIGLFAAISIYWVTTQILPERKRASLLRPSLADAVLTRLNEYRQGEHLPMLEMDEDLLFVAEGKATHQLMTGRSEEGWDYPPEYAPLLGRSLLMEALFRGTLEGVVTRMTRQRDVLDPEWVRCGIGVASSARGEVVVALILCRESWEPTGAMARDRSLVERLVLGD
jgi:hypothetical protein